MRKLHVPRYQITEVALHIYAARGPQGLTMRRIAGALGVQPSALYRHFESKAAIVEAVASAADSRLACALQSKPQRPKKGRLVEALSQRALKFAVEYPHLFRLAARQGPHSSHEGSRASVLTAEVASAIRAGQLCRTAPEVPARLTWTQSCGLAALRESEELADDRALRQAWTRATWDLRQALGARGCVAADGREPDRARQAREQKGAEEGSDGGSRGQLSQQGQGGISGHQGQR